MIDLREYFDRVLVLNLDVAPERYVEFQKRADALSITGYERYRAIHGDTCPAPCWFHNGHGGANGAWGCLMSHFRIAQDAMMDGLDNYLVMEDDACFSKDFAERLPKVMEEIEKLEGEWDMFYLGGQHLYKETSPPWHYRDGIVRCNNVNRTHAMVVSKRFMLKFSQHILHAPDYIQKSAEGTDMHIDHQLGNIHRGYVTLAAQPWLCGQAANKSNVNGHVQQEQWWHDNGWGK